MLGPFRQGHRQAMRRVAHIVSAVAALCFLVCPPAVAGFVVPVVVDPVEAVLWRWPLTHVSKEVAERGAPPIAYVDAATAIERISLVLLIAAAGDHPGPGFVLGRVGLSVGYDPIGPGASARFDFAGAEGIRANLRLFAAIAYAPPKHARSTSPDRLNGGQTVELLPGNINGTLPHSYDYSMQRLSGGLRDILNAALRGRPIAPESQPVAAGGGVVPGRAASHG